MSYVTIVVPVYGMPAFLQGCFDSIAAQTFTDWDAILVDDGSPDNSGRICDEWAQKDPRFTVIHKPNGGVCSARNVGIDASNSKYVLLMDQDDRLSPYALEFLVRAQKEHPSSFVLSLHTEDYSKLTQSPCIPSYKYYPKERAAFLYNRAPFPPPWAKLLDKNILQNCHFREDIRDGYEDRPFFREYLKEFWRRDSKGYCVVVQEPLYFWERDNEGSVSQSGRQPLKPWHMEMFDGFLTDCLTVYGCTSVSLQYYMLEYVQTIAFSLSCLPENEQQSALDKIANTSEYKRMISFFPESRFYSVFYYAFKSKRARFICRLSRGRLKNDKYYWRCYHLFRWIHPLWSIWTGLDNIPGDKDEFYPF